MERPRKRQNDDKTVTYKVVTLEDAMENNITPLEKSDFYKDYQYSPNDVVCLGGADYNSLSMTVTDIKNAEDDKLTQLILPIRTY